MGNALTSMRGRSPSTSRPFRVRGLVNPLLLHWLTDFAAESGCPFDATTPADNHHSGNTRPQHLRWNPAVAARPSGTWDIDDAPYG